MDFDHPENLLDHGQLVRSLAGALVHGAADADDVAQGAMAAALAAPRPAGFPLPRWLMGVVRNVARRTHRDRRRRAAREVSVARPEALRSTAEVVELEELRQLVVAAVLSLPDPQRSVVLLRYYDGLPPRAIAARLALPAATVRSHLHRALAALRQRLDRDWRGGRAAWTALLLPMLRMPRLALRGTVTKTARILCATALVATGALLYALQRTPAPPTAELVAAVPAAAQSPHAATPAEPAASRSAVATEPPPPPATAAQSPPALLHFATAEGTHLGGAALQQAFAAARTEPGALLLDAAVLELGGIEGIVATRFGEPDRWQTARALQVVAEGAEVRDLPAQGRFHLLVARPGAPAHLTPEFELPAAAPLVFTVPLPPTHAARTVRIVTDGGAPAAGARLVAYTEFGDDRAFVAGTVLTADARGEATLNDAVPPNPQLIRPAIWWAETQAGAARLEGDGPEFALPLRGACAGTVTGPDGAALAAATVVFACDKGPRSATRSDAAGAYRLDELPAARGMLVQLSRTTAEMHTQGLQIRAGAERRHDFTSDMGTARVVGRVTAGGQPVAGLMVLAASRGSQRQFTRTAADGTWQFDRVAEKARFAVLLGDPGASDDFSIRRNEPLALERGGSATFDLDLPRGCLRVRVLDATNDQPLAGVVVSARPARAEAQRDRFPGCDSRLGWAALTDRDGAVLLLGLPEGEPHAVAAGGKSFTRAETGVAAPALDANAEPIVLRVARK